MISFFLAFQGNVYNWTGLGSEVNLTMLVQGNTRIHNLDEKRLWIPD